MFLGVFAASLVAVAVTAVAPAPPAPQQDETRVYISVTGRDGEAVTVLKQDISVSEDGQSREVLRLERAEVPPQIALLVDDSQAAQSAIAETRTALRAFVTRVLEESPETQIALISFGERPTLLVDYTSNPELLDRGINRIFARPGSGAYMLEALVSAAHGIKKRKVERAHMIVIGTEGIEFSNDHFDRVLESIADSGATLWALTLTSGPRAPDTDETRNRAVVLGRGTDDSGGRQYQVLANSAISRRLDAVAGLILGQYVVTYARPDTLVPPKALQITVSTPGAEVLVPDVAPPVRKTGLWQ